MRDKISQALKDAMKARDKRRVSTLRLIGAAINDRDIVARGQGQDMIDDSTILDVMAKMIKQRRESAETYEQADRQELADQEREEIAIITEFLPRQLDEEEIFSACEKIIAELSAESLKDMGRTMSALKENYAGQMDFTKAGKIVRQILGADRA
jgi:uncharacterized protein YqeY